MNHQILSISPPNKNSIKNLIPSQSHPKKASYHPPLDQDSASSVLAAFLQQPTHLAEYGSNSGPVFGVLGNMKDTFAADLEKKQTEIKNEESSYKKMKAALNQQLKSQRAAQTHFLNFTIAHQIFLVLPRSFQFQNVIMINGKINLEKELNFYLFT